MVCLLKTIPITCECARKHTYISEAIPPNLCAIAFMSGLLENKVSFYLHV
jgi:hypothetical protein